MAHHLFLEVEEVVCLVDEEDLESRAAQIKSAQVDLSDLREGPFEVVAHSFRKQADSSLSKSFMMFFSVFSHPTL